MANFSFTINNRPVTIEAEPQMPSLWAIRDIVMLTGTKFGCGMAQCGACTIHLNGNAVRSCVLPIAEVAGKEIITIEGISQDKMHPVQQVWLETQVTQCGYCQSGQIMSAVALLNKNPKPTNADIDAAMRGNICRCGTYQRIRQAIHAASEKMLKLEYGTE
jgi:isoquinoline 1-oxidoreductase subunit alpha